MSSKLIDLETAYFPEILIEMYNLVHFHKINLSSLDKRYGQKLARYMSRKKSGYEFLDFIRWGGEALLLKLRETGAGGTNRVVAAKIANPGFNCHGRRDVFTTENPTDFETKQKNSFRDRFERGIRLHQESEDGISFTHGSIPKIIEMSQKPLYYIMQYVNGVDFELWVTRASLPERLDFFEQTLKFLGELHLHGTYHRDLKPNNIMVRQEKPVLIDFTLAKNIDDEDNITVQQFGVGCRLYAAPETLHDIRKSDWRSDIYSLGKMLELTWTQKAPTTDGEALSKPFFRVYEKATQYNKGDRYQFISEFLKDFQKAKMSTTLPVKAAGSVKDLGKILWKYPRIKKIAIPLYELFQETKEF